jgi:hypothetical protein
MQNNYRDNNERVRSKLKYQNSGVKGLGTEPYY